MASSPLARLRCYTSNGKALFLSAKLGSGGEGDIYEVLGQPGWAAKIYLPKNRTPERKAKLQYMQAHPPQDPFTGGHLTFAWPLELLYGAQQEFLGFVMPRLETRQTALLFEIYHPTEARKRGLGWRFRLAVAHNLCAVLGELHARGYVVGDLNESNLLVHKNGLITLVDCDSLQVRDGRRVFHCRVQKPEYTPPELQGQSYANLTLTPQHDAFALAVLIFQLLMEGRHPFSGRGVQTPEEGIRAGRSILSGLEPTVGTPNPAVLSPSLRRLFLRAFGKGQRPRATDWKTALEAEYKALNQCPKLPTHQYGGHLKTCPWCSPGSLPKLTPPSPRPGVLEAGRRISLGVLPTAVWVGLLLGLFRLGVGLTPGLEGTLNFPRLVGENAVWRLSTGWGVPIQVGLVGFYAAALTLCALGAWVLWARRGQRLWLALTALIVLPYFALPRLLSGMEPGQLEPLQPVLAVLHGLTLVMGEAALALTALPGLLLMVGLEALTKPLHPWGMVWAWGVWGAGFGFLLGLYGPLQRAHRARLAKGLLYAYILLWLFWAVSGISL
ncbi:MAG: hypothetical protein K6T57_04180 [Thermaceae bacterium]|nr:hypothetical protein [Thermaceae bacterium]